MKEQLLEGFDYNKYNKIDENITKYYTTEDQLYNTQSSVEMSKQFELSTESDSNLRIITVTGTTGSISLSGLDKLATFYTVKNSDQPNDYIIDRRNNEIIARRKTGSASGSETVTLYKRILKLEEDSEFDKNNHYYRIKSVTPATNYKVIDNVIVFNNIHTDQFDAEQTGITVTFDKFERSPERKYYHGANDGIFEIENKNSLANAMNNDVKVMIKQNEQLMILGTLTAATFLVGAYVLMRD